MIAYIKGNITFKNPAFIYLETSGVGYHINISLQTYAQIEKLEQAKILTYLHVKEDSHTLYGFAEDEERQLFIRLISVSGIGPNTAQVMLSSLQPDVIKGAIIAEDVNTFNKVKGIGPKTAKRIILDLKDKIVKESSESAITFTPVDNTIRKEALSALVALGFARIQVQKALNKVLKEEPQLSSVEELVKRALKQMS